MNSVQKKTVAAMVALMLLMTASQAQTYSPYTPEQIQEFNRQPLAPAEGPFGPVDPSLIPNKPNSQAPLDARYIKNPDGEEEAQAQETDSAQPFEPIPATFTF